MVICLRNPHNVAESSYLVSVEGVKRGMIPHTKYSPDRFIQSYKIIAEWVVKNQSVPVFVSEFERLHHDTCEAVSALGDFIGEGDWSKVQKVIDPSLNRSKPQNVEHEGWPLAVKIFNHARKYEWQHILDLF